jgi:hypothetical protein
LRASIFAISARSAAHLGHSGSLDGFFMEGLSGRLGPDFTGNPVNGYF